MSHHKIKNIFQWEKRPDFDVKKHSEVIFSTYMWHIAGDNEQITHRGLKQGMCIFHFMESLKYEYVND